MGGTGGRLEAGPGEEPAYSSLGFLGELSGSGCVSSPAPSPLPWGLGGFSLCWVALTPGLGEYPSVLQGPSQRGWECVLRLPPQPPGLCGSPHCLWSESLLLLHGLSAP